MCIEEFLLKNLGNYIYIILYSLCHRCLINYNFYFYFSFRTLVAFGISALWHGIYTGYYVSLCSVPFYLAVEDIYNRQYRNYADSAGVSLICI